MKTGKQRETNQKRWRLIAVLHQTKDRRLWPRRTSNKSRRSGQEEGSAAEREREKKKKRTRVGQLTTVEEKKEAKENCYTIIEGAQGCFRSTCFRITQRISTEKKTKKRTQDMHIVETFIPKPQHQSEEMRKELKQAGMKRNCAEVMRRKERG